MGLLLSRLFGCSVSIRVGSALTPYFAIGHERWDREHGDEGDDFGEAEYDEGHEPSHHAYSESDAQEQYRAENVEEAWNIATVKRTKLVVCKMATFVSIWI